MSEKVTFGELIESIAAETDHSKQFTHDFLKDFVDIINGGLEEDRKVNIAGFGKFELKHVDEREGYNPQTEEKMTIPAHNRIVFKPYKNLRELVNAPYAHIEPELLGETPANSDESEVTDSTNDTKEPAETENTPASAEIDDEQADDEQPAENDFKDSNISTALPTSLDEEGLEDSPDNTDSDPIDDPFNFAKDESTESQEAQEAQKESADDDGDIVEFGADASDKKDTNDDILDRFMGAAEEESTSQNADSQTEDTAKSQKSDKASDDRSEKPLTEATNKKQQPNHNRDSQESTTGKKKPNKAFTPVGVQRPSRKTSKLPYVAAAVILLLLVVGGVWYYSSTSDYTYTTPLISSGQPTAPADEGASSEATNNQQEETNSRETEETPQSEAKNQSSPNNNNTSNSVTSAQQTAQRASSTTRNETSVEIEKGQTLWSLAEERYGNPRLWPWIYGHDSSLDDPDVIYAGRSLSVPLPSGPQNNLNATDSVGVAKGFLATYKWYKGNEEAEAKKHLWAAKLYYNNLQQIADIPIDKADLSFANRTR